MGDTRLEKIQLQISALPLAPGVYIIKDTAGKVIYVGKSKELRNRLRTHFTPSTDFSKSRVIREKGADIEVIVVRNEKEALLLEYNLIQEYSPPLNSAWKDGKTYPYVEVTTGEKYPRLQIVRSKKTPDSIYLGPFSDMGSIRRSLKYALQLFPVANCKKEIHKGDALKWAKTCIRRRTNQCMKPCEVTISKKEYRQQVNYIVQFLEGDLPEIVEDLEEKMQTAAAELAFEDAKKYRDLIKSIKRTLAKQTVIVDTEDMGVLIVQENEHNIGINLVEIRDSHVIRQNPLIIQKEDESLAEVVHTYMRNVKPQVQKILCTLEDDTVKDMLEELGYNIVAATAGEKEIIKLAQNNLHRYQIRQQLLSKDVDINQKRVDDLQEMLNLPQSPIIIDGFDISTLQGEHNVASCVRFQNGRKHSSGYRRFKIRTVEGQDDFASMEEAVRRRYAGYADGLDKFNLQLPLLILIDGGPEQLKRAKIALEAVGLQIVILGLAKREEEIYMTDAEHPLQFDPNRNGMLLLRSIRDEAHRFAITYQRKLREEAGLVTLLDTTTGIGEKRKQAILKEYKTIANIAKESSETLREKLHIPQKVASDLIAHSRKFITQIEERDYRRRKRRA